MLSEAEAYLPLHRLKLLYEGTLTNRCCMNKLIITLPHDFYSYLMVSNLLNQPVQ